MQSNPNHGIGRVCKVSKEEIVGQLAALMWWAEGDDEDRMSEHHRRTERLLAGLSGLDGAHAERVFPDRAGRPYPNVYLHVSPETGMTAADVMRDLESGDPPIATMSHASDPQVIRLDVRLCSDQEIDIISARVREALVSASDLELGLPPTGPR